MASRLVRKRPSVLSFSCGFHAVVPAPVLSCAGTVELQVHSPYLRAQALYLCIWHTCSLTVPSLRGACEVEAALPLLAFPPRQRDDNTPYRFAPRKPTGAE